ncbi:hypothetical protein BU25DRAFT_444214 [Macroventuria anomochaeta]|uniref:Uncharacterized protein n=1 Tax=Macroventuria anomochaeta TaxID=301207 RepID=A0ACB6SH22_9PLEO|nr:uncharacterized protein BU25DRAFT_444214 [Macroventuria anomochaeta]KAF2633476.1 hypothetical protein BU25DRAFT_444214 [Macroventuria anomochaeta]
MTSERRNSDDTIASYKRKKKQDKRPSPMSQEDDAQCDHDESATGAASSNDIPDNVSNVETEDDSETAMRWKELKAAKTEEEEIKRYERLQTKPRTKAEAEHDEDLHKLRLRRMREREATHEAERKATQALEAVQEPVSAMDWKAQQVARVQRMRNGKSKAPKPEQASALVPTTSSSGHRTSSAHEERHGIPCNFGHEIAFFASNRPSLKRTDTEVLTDTSRGPSPPPNAHWRDPRRQRGRLNVDYSGMDTEFILGGEFVDDVNTMLDFINGWPEAQFEDIRYAFERDPDNRGRRIEFIDLGDKKWGVRILNPLRKDSGTSYAPADIYTRDDLPNACQEHGCDEGCPRKISMEERITNLKKFREEQDRNTFLGNMAGAGYLAGPSLGVLPDVIDMPPPPIPPRSDKRKVSHGLPELSTIPLQPLSTLESLPSVSEPPGSPRPENCSLPDEDFTAEHIEDLERTDASLETQIKQIKQIKTTMAQIKGHLQSKQGAEPIGQDIVKEWLQNANIVSESSEGTRKKSAADKPDLGPIGGKLVHNEKIPTGPYSIRAEEHRLTAVFDKRSTVPELMDENIRNRPRKGYYTARVPPKSDSDSKCNDTPLPRKAGRPSSNHVDQSSSTNTQRVKFPRIEPASRERDQRKTQSIPAGVPNEGVMAHLVQGYSISSPSQEQTGKEGILGGDFASQFQDPIGARRLSESISVFEDTPMGEDVPMLPQDIQSQPPSEEPAVAPSTTSPDSRPPSRPSPRRLDEIDDDTSVWDPDEQPVAPAAPRIRDDMEIDSDIPVWDPVEEPARRSSDSRQESTLEERRTYQRHIKNMLRKTNARRKRRAAPTSPLPTSSPATDSPEAGSEVEDTSIPTLTNVVPAPSRIEAGSEGGSSGPVDLKGKRRAKAKESGDDKKLLEELFRKL